MSASAPVVAVVGATGAAGGTVLRVLAERAFPLGELRLLASERSDGAVLQFGDASLTVRPVSDATLDGVDIAFFAAGALTSRRHAPAVAARGGAAVDKSSAYRMDPEVPLVVPEVNAATLAGHRGIVANPNCVTIPLTVVLAPLHRAFGLRHVTLATYQAASGAGRDLVAELALQERADAEGSEPVATVYPHVLHGNVVPGGWRMHGADTDEEVKIIAETRRVLELPELPVSVTTVRVPVAVAHSAAVWVELDSRADAAAAREVLAAAPGVVVVDDPESQRYPTPRSVAGTDDVQVGRIRVDTGRENGLALFFSADNLRKGAATNAVQVAELLLAG
ncbi:MAG: aspartate-semialdehyde dehydrogenase [Chloroflexi bacterium]|nr:MAG: aspartate-semialdehyde dehydrogenase [Chloroflexota bacterium]